MLAREVTQEERFGSKTICNAHMVTPKDQRTNVIPHHVNSHGCSRDFIMKGWFKVRKVS
jgi:hypothetical protein